MAKLSNLVLTAALFGTCISQVNAELIEYDDQMGTDVMYVEITEDTRDVVGPLFGEPDIVGNTLDFDPLSFTASATSSVGTSESEITDGQLNFTMMSKDDSFGITKVIINERGDYTLVGLGAALAEATVAAPVLYTITHVDGMVLGSPISGSSRLVFSPNLGSYSLPADVGTAVSWTGDLTIDIAALAAANNVTGKVTKVEFVLDNTLTAAAADGGSAFIAKKDGNITITIPEPSSMILLGLSLLSAAFIRRR